MPDYPRRYKHPALIAGPIVALLGPPFFVIRFDEWMRLVEFRWIGLTLIGVGVVITLHGMHRVARLERRRSLAFGSLAALVFNLTIFGLYTDNTFFPYYQEPVSIVNGGVTLAATLSKPHTGAPHPAVILVHGSQSHTRDRYRDVVDRFVRAGIAVLVYDKRGSGQSTGDLSNAYFEDLAQDAITAAAYLASRTDIRPDGVGLWGISQGGWVAPLAASMSDEIDFVIAVSGPGVSTLEQIDYQRTNALVAEGFSPSDATAVTELRRKIWEYWDNPNAREQLQVELDRARRNAWFAPAVDRGDLVATLPPADRVRMSRHPARGFLIANMPSFRSLYYDPVPVLETVTVPVLAIFGDADDLVPVDQSVTAVRAALTRAGNTAVTIEIFPGADHGLRMPSASDWLLAPRFAPGYWDLMVTWIWERAGDDAR